MQKPKQSLRLLSWAVASACGFKKFICILRQFLQVVKTQLSHRLPGIFVLLSDSNGLENIGLHIDGEDQPV